MDFVHFCNDHSKICVASNGERENVLSAICICGFKEYFSEDLIFTKSQVNQSKPAPDLFLYAAEKMNVEPARCLVIEDSPTGAMAGIRAGMDVFGFVGVAHNQKAQIKQLQDVGVNDIFTGFIHMQKHLGI